MEAGRAWRRVVGYEHRYFVSDAGDIWDAERSKLINRAPNKKGYVSVSLVGADGSRGYHFVHVLLATAFLGRRPTGQVVRHLDGVKNNNVLSNLVWGTARQNALDVKWHGGGQGHKLEVWEIAIIKAALQRGSTGASLARVFGVSESTIRRVRSGELHSDVPAYSLAA